jgi:hypothetical protein
VPGAISGPRLPRKANTVRFSKLNPTIVSALTSSTASPSPRTAPRARIAAIRPMMTSLPGLRMVEGPALRKLAWNGAAMMRLALRGSQESRSEGSGKLRQSFSRGAVCEPILGTDCSVTARYCRQAGRPHISPANRCGDSPFHLH